MPCTNPLTGYQLKEYEGETSPIVFKPPELLKLRHYKKYLLPCNKCEGCRGLRSMLRGIQIACELKTTEGDSYFLTTTYDDDHMPDNMSLHPPHMTKLIQDIRNNQRKTKYPHKFRYEQCGEYGTETLRPHHHVAAFNLELPDLELYSDNGKYKSFTSTLMEKYWPYGRTVIIPLHLANCIYIAQHSDKKIGNTTPNHEPEVLNPITGEISVNRVPEYSTRSSKPGIGAKWYETWGKTDLYNTDSIIFDGKEYKIPPFFDKLLKRQNPQQHEEIKLNREQKAIPRSRAELRRIGHYNKTIYKQKLRNKV